jgi:hypothetical protein
MVCWKETAEAARAVGAATPLLAKAERVILAGVEENDPSLADGLADLAISWFGMGSAPRSNACRRPQVRRARR